MTEVWNTEPYEDNGNWYINVVDADNAEFLRKEGPFISRGQAMTALEDNNKKEAKKIEANEKYAVNQESVMLESMIHDEGLQEMFKKNGFLPKSEEELKEELDKFDSEFVKDELACENEAKGLLVNIADLYLKGKLIKNSEYLKYRLSIEKAGLSSVLFQLKTSRRAIHKISERIHMGDFTTKMIEVMTQLQRVVLDITKFQHTYLNSLEGSFKNLALDDATLPETEVEGGAEQLALEGGEKKTTGGLTTNNRKKLLEELNIMIIEAKEIKIPRSKNVQLDDPTDEMFTDYEEVERKDELLGDEKLGKTGLETYEDD